MIKSFKKLKVRIQFAIAAWLYNNSGIIAPQLLEGNSVVFPSAYSSEEDLEFFKSKQAEIRKRNEEINSRENV